MILVVGGLADRVTELVCARLGDRGYPYRLLDLGFYPSGYEVDWRWSGSGVSGSITGDGWTLELDQLTGVYVRYLGNDGRQAPSDTAPGWEQALYLEYETGLMALLEELPCTVVNRAAGGISNGSKAYQALVVRQCGLRTPPTLVTNDPDAVRRFNDECGRNVVFKSLSGVRSIVRRLEPRHLDRLPLLHHGPAQFQWFVPGHDVRVHTVGDAVFAARIHSEAVDYRYAARDGHDVVMEPTVLPPAVERACLRLARRLDLPLAGIDLKETPDGDYYCFEVNPSPGFLYYEQQARQPISAALADLLRHGVRGAPPEAVTPMS